MTEPVAPGQPAQSNEQPAQTPDYVPMAPPARKKSAFGGKRILLWLGVVIVVLIGSYVVKHVSGDPDVAKAGSCMSGQSESTLKVVDCNDSKAEWKVVGKVDDQQKDDKAANGLASACSKWPETEASFWKGGSGSTGYVLCLASTK